MSVFDDNLERAESLARFDHLLDLYLDDKATRAELTELRLLVMSGEFEDRFKTRITEIGKEIENRIPEGKLAPELRARMLDNILKSTRENTREDKRGWRSQWMAAAAAIVIIGIGVGFFMTQRDDVPLEIAHVPSIEFTAGGDKAILELADGRRVVLDSAGMSPIPSQGGTHVVNAGGKISYAAVNKASEPLFNTIATPRGGKYQIELADGSKVWMNAVSSLRYPVAFSGKDRVVELTGEAYFEIAKNERMPFKVRLMSGAEVEVLGTHFNVMAYEEEGVIKTTLLEGKVRVSSQKIKGAILSPNQQAQIFPGGKVSLIKNYDALQAIAWKNDNFLFNDTRLEDIMRQVTRWYDVEVVYEGNGKEDVDYLKTIEFIGEVSRRENAQEVLSLLKLTGAVDFEIKGRTIVVRKVNNR